MEFSIAQIHYSLEIIYAFVKSSLTTTRRKPKNIPRDSEYKNINSLYANIQTNITHILAAMSNVENHWHK